MSDRITRVNELLRREISTVLLRIMPNAGFDISALTVTQVSISPDLRNARVGISFLGHEHERQDMLNEIRANRKTIQKEVMKMVTLKYTPRLHFHLDASIEKGDRVLGLLHELEMEEAAKAEQHNDDEPAEEV